MIDRLAVTRFRRIVAALPAADDAAPLVRLAAHLAAACRAELSAVMLEDAMLARLARLPIARHLAVTTAASLPLTPDMLRLSVAASARQMRAMLARLPETANVSWTLHAATEDDEGFGIGAEDFLVLSARIMLPQTSGLRAGGPRSLVAALVLDADKAQRSIAVAFDGSPEALRALTMVPALAGHDHAHCRILVPTSLLDSAHMQVGELLQGAGVDYDIAPLERFEPEEIAAAVRLADAGLLLLPADVDVVWRLQAELGDGPSASA